MISRPAKICLAASAGGHLTQLLRLAPAWQGRHVFFVTTRDSATVALGLQAHAYSAGWGNRKHPLSLLLMFARCIFIYIQERPTVVVSTGAAVGCMMALIVKVFGGRVIWIETISHANYLTLSGRIIRLIADCFLVQWPRLADKYPDVKYVGSLI